MKLMMIAGEASGDIHGEGLIRSLRQNHNDADLFGIGGKKMLSEGFRPYFMLDTLQAHGFVELAWHLPRLYKTLWRMRDALIEESPDALILIDYPGFNLKLASYAREKGIPVIFFNSPQIWAWRKGRLNTIKRVVDKMIVLFSFEEKIYKEAGVDVSWVGHPLLDEIDLEKDSSKFRENLGLRNDIPLLVIAPGSRPSEMEKHLPTMLEALPEIEKKIGEFQCIIPVAESLDFDEVQRKALTSSVNLKVVPEQFIESVKACDAAIISSGTASLQTGLALKPFVIVYRVSPLTYMIAQTLAQTKYIGMVNILADKEIVPELIQNKFNVSSITDNAVRLLQDHDYRGTMIGELKKIGGKLGEPGAYKRAALCIEDFIN
ncbi:MAG: lipid-A-disaccharide synthase [Deltaproteobacteria bacterium]|nr:lipid-A-disaccharide synthase [Deltaproteobacteria bacterium]|tara:strand:- start:452 stop:1579 length:1128 start_codon:yes stop_codon:yes gene_type:complete